MLEVILVIMIVAIATAMVAPELIHFISDYDLSVEAKKIRARIRDVQQLAIVTQKVYCISFDTANENYSIIYDPHGSAVTIETLTVEKNIGLDQTTFSQAGQNKVDFDLFGSPSEGGSIILSDPGGNSTSISITTATGRVSIP